MSRLKYPIGQQDFRSIRENGCVYIDKTPFIEKLLNSGNQYYFLGRPRRFGKSLFLSTLKHFFKGERELFKGLYIDNTEWDWTEYPVIHIDLNADKYDVEGRLPKVFDFRFREWEKIYGVEERADTLSARFNNLIRAAHKKTGQKVVILVDEYDKPIVGNINNTELFNHYRVELASLYTNFKNCADDIQLVFLTGVSRFSKLSIFSDLNNLRDISFDDEFADVCGITEKELFTIFEKGIQRLAESMELTYDEACAELKKNYDGYKFAKSGSDIYNPWSLLNALQESNIGYYWNDTGYPSLIAEMLKNINADLEDYFDTTCKMDDLKGLDINSPKPLALLYQTGYLTIKSYNTRNRMYRLGIPNTEVKDGLFKVLLPYYSKCKAHSTSAIYMNIVNFINTGKPDKLMKSLQIFFAGISYKMKMENENNFHNAFYLLTVLLGIDADAEVATSDGSIDMVLKTYEYIYVIELKYDHSAEEALAQINNKNYPLRYEADGRKIIKIGANFSSETRTIKDWKIE
ncbi:MAG: ATP-binding protein [Muribaculum sp.]|nr:ATP-binding protein [Muribaculum sp.]